MAELNLKRCLECFDWVFRMRVGSKKNFKSLKEIFKEL